jgi:hypothetical protein
MGTPLQMPALTLRSVKGSALTIEEMDGNLQIIEHFTNALASFFGVALNADGSLQANSVVNASIKSREISADKIQLNFLPVVVDAGTPNAIAFANDPPITAYVNGDVWFIHVSNLCTGPTTINVDGIGPISLVKNGGQELAPGDYLANQFICAAYRNAKFYLLQQNQVGSGSGSGGSFSGVLKYEPPTAALPGNGLATTFTHAFASTPDDFRSCRCRKRCSY